MAGVIKKTKKSFWEEVSEKKPFFCLAPMADVTDVAFREILAKYGKPDVTWTEFVSADGLNSTGKKYILKHLEFYKKEKPIVAQIFGSKPESIKKSAQVIFDLGFDGIDINMGCPDKKVLNQDSGAALIKNKKLAQKIIISAKEGSHGLPVSVKTRLGFNKIEEMNEWIEAILETKLDALTVHLRTKKEMSLSLAHWEVMPEILKIRDKISPKTLIIGNGDVLSLEDGQEKISRYGGDGVMIGRGVFGNPWFFNSKSQERILIHKAQNENKVFDLKIEKEKKLVLTKLKILLEHIKLFEKFLGKDKNFHVMKKHFKAYVSNFKEASEFRQMLMDAKDFEDSKRIVKEVSKNISKQ